MPLKKLQKYTSEEEYIEHQKKKTTNAKVRRHFKNRFDKRVNIFKSKFLFPYNNGLIKPGWNALCLGARLGEEVQALKNLAIDAIGIDLVPCLPLVLEGNFMHIDYPDNHFDMLYTNSIDHAFDIKEMFKEAYRVLKNKGFFIVDVFPGQENVSEYEVYWLDVVEIIYKMCNDFNLELISVHAKLPRLYRKRMHKETQIIFRKGTNK